MKRREFITLIGGAAAWPLVARAQQPERIRRIAVLMGLAEDDPETKARLARFKENIEKLGWSEGRNVRIDVRFAPAGAQAQMVAKDLIALQPDVILAHSAQVAAALQKETRTNSGRVRQRLRSDRRRLHYQPSAAGRQFHGRSALRGGHPRQMAGDAQEIAPTVARAALLGDPKSPVYNYFVRAGQAPADRSRSNLCPLRSRVLPMLSAQLSRSRARRTAGLSCRRMSRPSPIVI